MKAKIIYISSFLAAFLIVTLGIVYFNSTYRDIFHFNFTKIKTNEHKTVVKDSSNVQMTELKTFFQQQLKNYIIDSLKTYVNPSKIDTVFTQVVKDSTLLDSLSMLKLVLSKTNLDLTKQNEIAKTLEKNLNSQPDSTYMAWAKKTAKLYETMDPVKAAKIIQGYSDNVARDIIYSMKQKKAAEVLAEFNPENVNRIMRAN